MCKPGEYPKVLDRGTERFACNLRTPIPCFAEANRRYEKFTGRAPERGGCPYIHDFNPYALISPTATDCIQLTLGIHAPRRAPSDEPGPPCPRQSGVKALIGCRRPESGQRRQASPPCSPALPTQGSHEFPEECLTKQFCGTVSHMAWLAESHAVPCPLLSGRRLYLSLFTLLPSRLLCFVVPSWGFCFLAPQYKQISSLSMRLATASVLYC